MNWPDEELTTEAICSSLPDDLARWYLVLAEVAMRETVDLSGLEAWAFRQANRRYLVDNDDELGRAFHKMAVRLARERMAIALTAAIPDGLPEGFA